MRMPRRTLCKRYILAYLKFYYRLHTEANRVAGKVTTLSDDTDEEV